MDIPVKLYFVICLYCSIVRHNGASCMQLKIINSCVYTPVRVLVCNWKPKLTCYLVIPVFSYQPGFYQQQVPVQPGFYPQQVPVPVPPNEPVPNVLANQQVADPPRVEAAANERPRPEIVRMNAQGGPVANDDDEDEVRNRDWLDWVYTFIRFLLLVCILYFYSSLDRFIATMTLIIVVYLWVLRWQVCFIACKIYSLFFTQYFASTVAFVCQSCALI